MKRNCLLSLEQTVTQLKRELDPLFEDKKSSYSKVGLPQMDEVVYAVPDEDGEPKKCGNCVFWVREGKCVLHPRDLHISKTDICCYWIRGEPKRIWEDLALDHPLDPKYSGLEKTRVGVTCDTCTHYFWSGDETGLCEAVKDGDEQAKVHPKAACSRWEADKLEQKKMNAKP